MVPTRVGTRIVTWRTNSVRAHSSQRGPRVVIRDALFELDPTTPLPLRCGASCFFYVAVFTSIAHAAYGYAVAQQIMQLFRILTVCGSLFIVKRLGDGVHAK